MSHDCPKPPDFCPIFVFCLLYFRSLFHEEVINENYTTDHGWNSLDNSTMQKEIQETLKDTGSAGILG
jgi:hypothetical protein